MPLEGKTLTGNKFWDQSEYMPLEIIAGPDVSEIPPGSAQISWETNRDSDSLVLYGDRAEDYPQEVVDETQTTSHTLTLDGLEPATTYHFLVESAEEGGEIVQSREKIFQTAAEPDDTDPSVSFTIPTELEGKTVLTATASDNTAVHKVEFLIDGVLAFIDYFPPYELPLDTRNYGNGQHDFTARAYDLFGNPAEALARPDVVNLIDESAPQVSFTFPNAGATVSGEISVTAALSDDVGLSQVFFKVSQGATVVDWGFESLSSNPQNATVEFAWDTTLVSNGAYLLGVGVYDTEGKYGSATRSVNVDQSTAPTPAQLKLVGRNLTRLQNGVTVDLVVRNVGEEAASNVQIEDIMQGFQPIPRTGTWASYAVEYDAYKREAECQITPHAAIAGGETVTFTYHAAPVLFYPNPPTPAVGSVTYIHYDRPGGTTIHAPVAVPAPQSTVTTIYNNALAAADYLIVTNPTRLFQFGYPNTHIVQELFPAMAQLAIYQNGVLGYLNDYSVYALNDLIKPSLSTTISRAGQWGTRLHADFRTALGGSMLIVGEVEIVPAWNTTGWNRHWNSGGVTNNVNMTDRPYADTSGDGAPELIVGRIIGNDPDDMLTALQTSINVYEEESGYGFDRSDALIVSGTGNGETLMVSSANDTASAAATKGFTTTVLHWSNYSSTDRYTEFASRTADQDVIYVFDHGNPSCLGEVCSWNLSSLNFGSTNPLVLAPSCSTGDYESGGDWNVAEAFLEYGAGVYIGATEVSPMHINAEIGKRFFNAWGVNTDDTVGKTLTAIERDRWSHGKWWQFWIEEYNLYGDPKYWAKPSSATSALAAQAVLTEPTSPLEIKVPDYDVKSAEGFDYVTIPDGDLWYEEGEPQVPYYARSYDYAVGYQIQDVRLIGLHDIITETGLSLPTTAMTITAAAPSSAAAPQAASAEWFPEMEYEWDVRQNPDGSITLVILLYPFRYNATTDDAEFFKGYTFELEYTTPEENVVEIVSVGADRGVYQPGESVLTDIEIDNTGEHLQDVIVSAQVKRYGGEDVIEGLLLQTLKDLEGPASFSTEWESGEAEPGHYLVEVTLKDSAGNLLDQESTSFQVGASAGEIIDFAVKPTGFEIGDHITATLTFSNTGAVEIITGTAVIKVRNDSGEAVEEFRHPVTDLPVDESASFESVWDTSGEEGGTYSFVGYVSYDGATTEPVTTDVSTSAGGNRIYLPLIIRS